MLQSLVIVKAVYRDLRTGHFVTEQFALKNPKSTTRSLSEIEFLPFRINNLQILRNYVCC